REAWRVAERLKQEKVPVLLRLNYTDQPQAGVGRRGMFGRPGQRPGPPTDPAQPATQGRRGTRPGATPPAADAPDEQQQQRELPERARGDQKRKQYGELHCAAVSKEKVVLFAFSSRGAVCDRPAGKFRDQRGNVIGGWLTAE